MLGVSRSLVHNYETCFTEGGDVFVGRPKSHINVAGDDGSCLGGIIGDELEDELIQFCQVTPEVFISDKADEAARLPGVK